MQVLCKKKCLWLEISSGGIKECGGRITDLIQENRLRFRKTKIKRDLARCWNAFKSMQITDKGKGISWKDKTMHLRARQKISYRIKLKKTKNCFYSDVQVSQEYKISWKYSQKCTLKTITKQRTLIDQKIKKIRVTCISDIILCKWNGETVL